MTWILDPDSSRIQFLVRHMMFAKVRGRLTSFSAEIQLDLDNPESTYIETIIDASSINTRDSLRDEYLRSQNFLDVDQYPQLYFKSTDVEMRAKKRARIEGELTIKEVTRPVELDVEFEGIEQSQDAPTNASFSVSTTIWRTDWNLTLEGGGWLVGDKIEIDIYLALTQHQAD